MGHKQIIILLGMMAAAPLLAQEDSREPPNPCTVEPIFHCVESVDDGSFIGHFGYRYSCPESDIPVEDRFVQIGDDNYFMPEPIDRGQPKVFMLGEHIDEFEVEFSAGELEKGKEFGWTVLKIGSRVDFSKTKDASLNCSNLPY